MPDFSRDRGHEQCRPSGGGLSIGNSQRAFLYTPGNSGGLVDFGRPASPSGLKASGQLAGTMYPPESHVFIYKNGSIERLGLGDLEGD